MYVVPNEGLPSDHFGKFLDGVRGDHSGHDARAGPHDRDLEGQFLAQSSQVIGARHSRIASRAAIF